MSKIEKFGPRAKFSAPCASSPAIAELLEMHRFKRPAKSKVETAFRRKYLDSIQGMQSDKAGNRFIRIGDAPVLWSSHTDTVHKEEGMQSLTYGAGILSISPESLSNCLGADCSAGVWIMRQMILRGVEGLYIFHDSEEIGGHGSSYIAKKTPELLHGINYAIAFDRKGTDSVITHQMGRCASNKFGDALSAALGGEFSCDDTGTFTDTANYIGLVSECTNISVGYYSAHTSSETLDVSFCAWLLERVCVLDVCALPVAREPVSDIWDNWEDDVFLDESSDLEDLTFHNPDIAAIILDEYGITPDIFRNYMAYSKKL